MVIAIFMLRAESWGDCRLYSTINEYNSFFVFAHLW